MYKAVCNFRRCLHTLYLSSLMLTSSPQVSTLCSCSLDSTDGKIQNNRSSPWLSFWKVKYFERHSNTVPSFLSRLDFVIRLLAFAKKVDKLKMSKKGSWMNFVLMYSNFHFVNQFIFHETVCIYIKWKFPPMYIWNVLKTVNESYNKCIHGWIVVCFFLRFQKVLLVV